jgi:hypothetical protein
MLVHFTGKLGCVTSMVARYGCTLMSIHGYKLR